MAKHDTIQGIKAGEVDRERLRVHSETSRNADSNYRRRVIVSETGPDIATRTQEEYYRLYDSSGHRLRRRRKK